MGILFSKLFTYLFGKNPIKIIILGLDNAGKTTILYRLKLGKVVKTLPTIGSNTESVDFNGSKLEIFDLSGQRSSRLTWRYYFDNTNCIMFVIDSSDKKRIDIVKDDFLALLQSDQLKNTPMCICANKQDLPLCMSDKDIIDTLELNSINDREWNIFKTIGKTGEGLDDAFKWISNIHNSKLGIDNLQIVSQNDPDEELTNNVINKDSYNKESNLDYNNNNLNIIEDIKQS